MALKKENFSNLKLKETGERAEEFERVGTHTNNCFGKWKIKLINFHTLTYSCNMEIRIKLNFLHDFRFKK